MANQTKSYRKFVASAATATLVASALVPVASAAPASTSATFTDVAPQYLEAVNHLVDSKITVGKTPTQFGTYDNITRVDAAVWIAKAVLGEGEIANAIPSSFTDVRDNAKNYVDALKEHNILNGKTDTRFGSYDEIRRGEAAIILANAYKITGDADNVTFTDVADRYKEAVAALVDNGITQGKKGNRFGQNDPITRGELAVWVQRLDTLHDEDTLKVLTAKAISATEIEVMFNDRNTETFTVDKLELGEITEVEVEYKGEKFLVNVKWDGEDASNVAPGTVAFANQPAAKALPAGAPLNEVYKFQVTAGEDAITLRSVQLKQYGTAMSDDHDVKYVHLSVDGDIKATGTLNARNEVRLTRSLNVPANSTVEFTVLADVSTGATPTATVQFGIESINAFTANATLNGNFPNVGNAFNVVAGNIGTLAITNANVSDIPSNFNYENAEYKVETGELQEELGKFTLQAGSREGVNVKRITLKTDGGINADDFENLYLYDNNGKDRIEVQGVADRNQVVFDLSKAAIQIDRNQAKSLVLKGDSLEGGKTGYFKVDKSYDVVAEGLNSGYNNILSLGATKTEDGKTVARDNAQHLGTLNVEFGKPIFRVSTATPKQGDKIVASTSQYGLVREYTFNSTGQDVTLKDATLYIDAENYRGSDISKDVRTIELYDATTGSVIKSYDVKPGDEGLTGDDAIKLDNLNWLIDATQKKDTVLQLRAVATSDDAYVEKLDLRLGDINYEVQTATGSDKDGTVGKDGLPARAQFKEFVTSGGVDITSPEAAVIDGYTISGGLSEAPLGGIRIEAKDEALKLTDAEIQLNIQNADQVFANPVLKYDGKVVAYGNFESGTSGDTIKFNIDRDAAEELIVETGSDNRKVLKLYADVLEVDAADFTNYQNLEVTLKELSTRGVNSNIVSRQALKDDDKYTSLLGKEESVKDWEKSGEGVNPSILNYGHTTIAVDVSSEAYDSTPSNDARVLKFTVTNLAPNNNSSQKTATINSVAFKNLFDFSSRFEQYASADSADLNLFNLRESDNTPFNQFNVDTFDGDKSITLTGEGFDVKGDDDEEFFLHANFSATHGGTTNNVADFGIFYNTTMQLDLDPSKWNITAGGENVRPLIINEKGPRITIK